MPALNLAPDRPGSTGSNKEVIMSLRASLAVAVLTSILAFVPARAGTVQWFDGEFNIGNTELSTAPIGISQATPSGPHTTWLT